MCETGPSVAGEPLLVCLLETSSDGVAECAPSCMDCTFTYTEEDTPFGTYLSHRALRSGSVLAVASQYNGSLRGSLGELGRAMISVGGYTCDADPRAVGNSDDFFAWQRLLGCKLDDLHPAGFHRLTFSVFPRSLAAADCAGMPCVPEPKDSLDEVHGYGRGALRSWHGVTRSAPSLVHPHSMEGYDVVVYPKVGQVISPQHIGAGGGEVAIRGSGFSTVPGGNQVSVRGKGCEVTHANETVINCKLNSIGNESAGCLEFDILIGAHRGRDHVECIPRPQNATGTNTTYRYSKLEHSVLNSQPEGFYPWSHCSDVPGRDQYLEWDLGEPVMILFVDTQGRGDYDEGDFWVQSYRVFTSDDGVTWADTGTVYPGNIDGHSVVRNYFDPPLKHRFLRIFPEEFIGYRVCMRAAFYVRWPSCQVVQYDAARIEIGECEPSGPLGFRELRVWPQPLEPNIFWAEDICPKDSYHVRSDMHDDDIEEILCCSEDGSECRGRDYEDRCFYNGTWALANATCVHAGMRLCTKPEINSGLCCDVPGTECHLLNRSVWTNSSTVRQKLEVAPTDFGGTWPEELWVRCREKCPDYQLRLEQQVLELDRIVLVDEAEVLNGTLEFSPLTLIDRPVGPFPAGRGLRYAVYPNPSGMALEDALSSRNIYYPVAPLVSGTLEDVARGAYGYTSYATALASETGVLPAASVLVRDIVSSDDTTNDMYVQEIVGVLIPPFTANYSLYLAADDSAEVAMSFNGISNFITLALAETELALPERRHTPLAYYSGPCCPISSPVNLTAQEPVLLRIRHLEKEGSDFVRLAMRIHGVLPNLEAATPSEAVIVKQRSFFELQRLAMYVDVVRETHIVDVRNCQSGRWQIRLYNNGRRGLTPPIQFGVGDWELIDILWDTYDTRGSNMRVLDCKPEVYVNRTDFSNMSFAIEFPCLRPASGQHATIVAEAQTYIRSTPSGPWSISSYLQQSASFQLAGHFTLRHGAYVTRPIMAHDWRDIRPALAEIPGLSDIDVWAQREFSFDGFEGWEVAVHYMGSPGDMPNLTLDFSQAEGSNVSLTLETISNGTEEDLFVEEIPADWFRAPQEQPQVDVVSNEVSASAPDIAEEGAVRLYAYLTARILHLEPSMLDQAGVLTLSLQNVDARVAGNLSAVSVYLGSNPCVVLTSVCAEAEPPCEQSFGQHWRITCELLDWEPGRYLAEVQIGSYGFATLQEDLPLVELRANISSVFPAHGGWGGGSVIHLSGLGLNGPQACSQVTIGGRPLLDVPPDSVEERASEPSSGEESSKACLVPAANDTELMPPLCELRPELFSVPYWCDPVPDAVVPMEVGSYAVVSDFSYVRELTPVISAVIPVHLSAATSGLLRIFGDGFLMGAGTHNVSFGGRVCYLKYVSANEVDCFLPRFQVKTGDPTEVYPRLYVAGAGYAVPAASLDVSFQVVGILPGQGSLVGGSTVSIRGRGFHAEASRFDIFFRLTYKGSLMELPCTNVSELEILEEASVERGAAERALQCVISPLLNGDEPDSEVPDMVEADVVVRLNNIESACAPDALPSGCHFIYAKSVSMEVVNILPLEGHNAVEPYGPIVKLEVGGWDSPPNETIPSEVSFGRHPCPVDLAERMSQECPPCSVNGLCVSYAADNEVLLGNAPALRCVCDFGWFGDACDNKCDCETVGTEECNVTSSGDYTCLCLSNHTGARCHECEDGYFRDPDVGNCGVYCVADETCSGHGSCDHLGRCVCDDWWYGESCDCHCSSKGICNTDGGCLCDAAWDGDECNTTFNASIAVNCPECSGKGICAYGDDGESMVCLCTPGTFGEDCSWSCADHCNPYGTSHCLEGSDPAGPPGECGCLPGYYGMSCENHCDDCSIEGTSSCEEGIHGQCHCFDDFYGMYCENACTCNPAGTYYCSKVTGECFCREEWSGIDCESCATNYYPEGTCNIFCNREVTCNGHGDCNAFGSCECDHGWNPQVACSSCSMHFYPAETTYLEPYEDFSDCFEPENISTTGASSTTSGPTSTTGWVTLGPAGPCNKNITLVDAEACSLYCEPTTTCSGHGQCDTRDASCHCYEGYHDTHCDELCSPDCVVAGTHTCNEGVSWDGSEIMKCTCRDGFYAPACQFICTGCKDPGTLSCTDGAEGDGSCVCKTGWIGYDCSFCMTGWYPSDLCVRHCMPDDKCSGHGTCDSEGFCVCEGREEPKEGSAPRDDEWYGHYCNCLTATNQEVCGGVGRGFCDLDGQCTCDARWDGATCGEVHWNVENATKGCPEDCGEMGVCVEDPASPGDYKCSCAPNKNRFGDLCDKPCPGCDWVLTEDCFGFGSPGTGLTCVCKDGYWGVTCLERCVCHEPGTAKCEYLDGFCTCNEGWEGERCDRCEEEYYPKAFDLTAEGNCKTFCNATSTCSGHGECTAEGRCDCYPMWQGRHCDQCAPFAWPKVPEPVVVVPEELQLPAVPLLPWETTTTTTTPYYGPPCEVRCTEATCSGHGACGPDGFCLCNDGWYGGCKPLPGPNNTIGEVAEEFATYCAGASENTACFLRCTCRDSKTESCNEGAFGDGSCNCIRGWGGAMCTTCADGFYPARTCSVECRPETTCSGHGQCSDVGICVALSLCNSRCGCG